ncbi:MAG: acyltransferase [Bacteriovoracaceae bacterium]|nr:acyltransferase [Bacteriovoracaceae bacterium]
MKNIKILTGLRFYAAIHVILFHNLYLFGSFTLYSPIQNFLSKGETAVSFFFLLSGFLLAYVYQDKLETKKEKIAYLSGRLAKLYPLYFLAMLIDAPRVVKYFFEQYEINTATLKILISGTGYILMLQSWVPNLTPVWNSPAWSLSCEMFFYTALIFLMPRINRTKYNLRTVFILYLMPAILFFVLFKIFNTNSDSLYMKTLWRSFPPLRLSEFVIGCYLFKVVKQENKLTLGIKRNCTFVFWSSIILSIFLAMSNSLIEDKLFSQMVALPFFALLIMSSYYEGIKGSELFTSRIIQQLGLSSYASYILHQPLKTYFTAFEPSVGVGVSYLSSVLILSLLLYYFFEVPLQVRLKRKLTDKFSQ